MILKALFGMLDDYLLREMIGFVSNSMIEMEVEELTGAAYGEAYVAKMNNRKTLRKR